MFKFIFIIGLAQAQSDEEFPDLRHRWMAWEKTHLNPFKIEDYLHDTYGLVSPVEYLYDLTP